MELLQALIGLASHQIHIIGKLLQEIVMKIHQQAKQNNS